MPAVSPAGHLLGVALGDEDGLGLQFLQRKGEHLFRLRPVSDENVVGKRLGDALGGVLIGQPGLALNVDDFE
jgi:hypothetical protein